jgi:hypothetical protein
MTYDEQQERLLKIQKAQAMFPEEKNMSVAIKLYEQATGEIIGRLNTKDHGNKPKTIMDDYNRVPCDVCGTDMQFRVLNKNDEGYKTQLVCSKPECDNVLNSEFDIGQWRELLKKKEEK